MTQRAISLVTGQTFEVVFPGRPAPTTPVAQRIPGWDKWFSLPLPPKGGR